ncbi:MAG: serine/threonine-protein kinase [Pseudolabrys sp.]|nr:serine/threonine-protein kinase [Pseudolabrys sp.]
MAKYQIKLLNDQWEFDDSQQLGESGGFGEVYLGLGKSGEVAIKRLKMNAMQAAHRELSVAARLMDRSFRHVVPILDVGQDAQSDRYFIVMPVCEKSLQDEIDKADGGLSVEESMVAIRCIVDGLSEVRDVTHRDLKPSNVLFQNGAWKVADFGIAKFVEDATSLETLRECLTPMYAAPEQWRGERPTEATDVYSLGCIVHALCTGNPPFSGAELGVREQHLHAVPAPLANLPPRLSSFVSQMLRKAPAARPTLARCIEVFSMLEIERKELRPARHAFAEAVGVVTVAEAKKEADRLALEKRAAERDELFRDADRELVAIRKRLVHEVSDMSHGASAVSNEGLTFGRAIFQISASNRLFEVVNRRPTSAASEWNILGWSTISVSMDGNGYRWSATLLYASKKNEGYRWFEVAFWSMGGRASHEPFSLEASSQDLHFALSPVMHHINIAYGPFAIDGEDEEKFQDRWIDLIGRAATGKLRQPSQMPIKSI